MVELKLAQELPSYNYEDYLQWEGRWEIINGVPYAMSPMPKGRHQRISNTIAFELQQKLKNCKRCKAYLPVDWEVDRNTIVQPDNLIVCDLEDEDFSKLTKTPSLIVEILSPSTALKDKNLKYRIYEESGVSYYIIIDPDTLIATVYHLKDKKYELSGVFEKEGRYAIALDSQNSQCAFEIDFGEVFDL